MDWNALSTIASIILSLLAITFSIVTNIQVRRDKEHSAKRKFLEESMVMAQSWLAFVYGWVQDSKHTFEHLDNSLGPLIEGSRKLVPQSRRWHGQPYYRKFDALLEAISDVGSALAAMALADQEKQDNQNSHAEALVDALRKTFDASKEYVTLANETLIKMRP